MAVSFFGIRGVGSFFYLAFAISKGKFENPEQLWGILSLVVFASIIIHGLTASTAMKRLSGKFQPLSDKIAAFIFCFAGIAQLQYGYLT